MGSPPERLASLGMDADHLGTRSPDPRWADPLIVLMVLLIALLMAWRLGQEGGRRPPPPERITASGRLIELGLAAKGRFPRGLDAFLPKASLAQAASGTRGWDRALCGVLAAESGDLTLGRRLALDRPFPGDDAFRRCFAAAYQGASVPAEPERRQVARVLGNGYAAGHLEARLLERTRPREADRLRDGTWDWALPRLVVLVAVGILLSLALPAGLAMGIVLAAAPRRAPLHPLPDPEVSGRGLALVLLGWFLAFLLSGLLGAGLARVLPVLAPVALPLVYAFHAGVGLTLLCRMEGLTLGGLLHRWLPGSHGRSLAWGLGYLALAIAAVMAVTWLLRPILRPDESPQRELMDLVTGTEGLLPVGLLFVTISFAAPLFEEGLFRGTLLPWLGHRLAPLMGARSGWMAALLLSGLGFGLIHLQPAALPALSTLGLVLGLAFLHTGNLWSAILVHALWNGGVFLFYRTVMG